MNKIAFPIVNQATSFDLPCSDQRYVDLPFDLQNDALRFAMLLPEDEAMRELLFHLQRDSNTIPFGLLDRAMSDATLGVLDPYVLGTLDSMTIDFKVWNDTNALILNKVPGADGSIFDFTCPICETFPYRTRPVSFTLDLGKYFMGGYGHIPSKLYMFIRNGVLSSLPYPSDETEIYGSNINQYIHNKTVELLSVLTLYCKSVYGGKALLGDFDPFTLGELDPYPLGLLVRDTATALRVSTQPAAYMNSGVDIHAVDVSLALQIEEPTPLTGAVELAPRGISKSIVGLKTRRKALLGDMDDKPLSRLDGCRLDIHYYGKIPAIVTVDAET